MNRHTEENHDTNRERQHYARPALREYGSVGQLTQSGTMGLSEPGMSMSGNFPNEMV